MGVDLVTEVEKGIRANWVAEVQTRPLPVGLVERFDEPGDRRAFRIHLTRAGERTFGAMARAHEEWVVGLLAGLSHREKDELLKLLAKLKQHAVEVAP